MKKILIILILSNASFSSAQSFQDARKYRVTAIRNANEKTMSISNSVETTLVSYLYLPKAFSPNGDGLNDTFGAIGSEVQSSSGKDANLIQPDFEKFTMRIFNRWGEMIFESDKIARRWDGKHEGMAVQQDVYVYQLFAITNGNVIKKTGTVTVVL